MTTRELARPPRLPAVLLRGALGSVSKRGPHDEAHLPAERLVLPAAGVDPARLRAYARVCGFPDPASDPADGAAPLPAGYPHVLGFPLAMRLLAARDFPFPLLGLVHTGVELTQHRPLHVRDRPELTVYAEGLAAHRRGSRFDVVTEARLDGRLVWHSRSTYLCRHRRTDGTDGAAGTEARHPERDGPVERPRPGERAQLGEPSGPLPARAEWRLPSALGRRYAAASGDRNPIHLHPLTAKPFGFPRHIAHGMWTFARCLAQAQAENAAEAGTGDGRGAEPLTAYAEFKAPVPLPCTVTYGSARPDRGSGTDGAGPDADPEAKAEPDPDQTAGEVPCATRLFELRSGGAGAEADAGEGGTAGQLHLTGAVSSGLPSSGSPDPTSRSS